jgi:hypothetical protein
MKGLDIPLLSPPPAHKKAAAAAPKNIAITSGPTSALSTSTAQTTELVPRAAEPAKQPHPTQNTPSDIAAPPPKHCGRPRASDSITAESVPGPVIACPLPQPVYHGYMTPSMPARSPAPYSGYSGFSSPPFTTPLRFPTQNPQYYSHPIPVLEASPFAPPPELYRWPWDLPLSISVHVRFCTSSPFHIWPYLHWKSFDVVTDLSRFTTGVARQSSTKPKTFGCECRATSQPKLG